MVDQRLCRERSQLLPVPRHLNKIHKNPFYNRVTELEYFKNKFRSEVGFVTVLVGPRNGGKSVSSAFLCFPCLGGCDSDKKTFLLLVQLLNRFLFTVYSRDC
jgi:hypothetical protein